MTDRASSHPPVLSPAVPRVEIVISSLLRVGVAVSLAVVILGTIISFVHHPGYLWSSNYLGELTTPGKALPHSLPETLAGVRAGRGQAIVIAGLLLLIATPVLRVAVSIFAFLLQRDWIFTLLTAMVLGFLLLSFFLGKMN